MVDRADIAGRVITAALGLAADFGWRHVGFADIAAESGVSLAEIRTQFPSKPAILSAFNRMIDEKVLAGSTPSDDSEPARDRLFDVIMRRFDAMAPYKDGILAALHGTVPFDPAAMICGACNLLNSMSWMLEAGGVDSAGPRGKLRAKGLLAVYLCAFRAWSRDDSPDLAHTMAVLDKNLRRAENLAGMLGGGARKDDEAAAGEEVKPVPKKAGGGKAKKTGTRAKRARSTKK